MNMRQEANRI